MFFKLNVPIVGTKVHKYYIVESDVLFIYTLPITFVPFLNKHLVFLMWLTQPTTTKIKAF